MKRFNFANIIITRNDGSDRLLERCTGPYRKIFTKELRRTEGPFEKDGGQVQIKVCRERQAHQRTPLGH